MPAPTFTPRALTPRAVLALILVLTIARIALLLATPLNLHGDEAQYWYWSRTLDWGYFSKPPLIAWAIRFTTTLFGNDEWAVRLAAPLAQGAAATILYFLARRLYGDAAGMWAAIGWALMPGVQLSSVIISTDALMLPLWAAGLYCAWRLIETRASAWAIGLGIALGFTVLAKYAGFYFLIGAALACLMSARTRAALLSVNGALALVITALVVSPNIIWNATHDFETVKHTASNTDIGASLFHPESLFFFLSEQLGVVGPLLFGALVFLLIDAARRRKALDERDRFLLAFAIPALAIICVQALISRANANWAVAAYPAAIVWIAGRLATGPGVRALIASAVVHTLIAIVFFAGILSPHFSDAVGLANSLKRARGWEETAAIVTRQARQHGQLTAIMVDNRLLFYDLTYYWRDTGPPAPLRMWQLEANPGSSAEMSDPMRTADGGRVFVVMASPSYRDLIFADFQHAQAAGQITVPLGKKKVRTLDLVIGETFAPVPRDAAFMAKLNAQRAASRDD